MLKVQLNKKFSDDTSSFEVAIDVTIKDGSFNVIYGSSGAGKTTLLRMISGLLKPDSGFISYRDKVWLDSAVRKELIPVDRGVALVSQENVLFPNMSVSENLDFARRKNSPQQNIDEVLSMLELEPLLKRLPKTLSKGQMQRVLLARALVQFPQILLLDEPFSGLDHQSRLRLQEYLLNLQRDQHLLVLMVTHDLSEVFRMADEVYQIEHGRILRTGSPQEVFLHDSPEDQIKLPGVIVSIQQNERDVSIAVLCGRNLVKLDLNKNEAKSYQIGEEVFIESALQHPSLQKR